MLKIRYLVVTILLVLSPAFLTDSGAAGERANGILLYEIQPFGGCEGLSIFNYGPEAVDLNGWVITANRGTLTFVDDVYIGPGMRLTIVKAISSDDWFSGRDNVITITDECIQKKGSYGLADAGDIVYIHHGNELIDSFCYGNKETDQGWAGEPVRIPSNKYALRIGFNDTASAEDWIATKPGLTNNVFDPGLFFDSVVTPFSFPESQGDPIFKEIENAQNEILISIYLLTSPRLVALLCDLSSQRGVRVCIILEGNVLGVDIGTELTLMRSLVDAGGEVYLINDSSKSGSKRFTYFHNKYAVIDSKKVIITTENWTSGNLSGNCSNRGWGVVVESNELAEYAKKIFLSDLDLAHGDVRSLLDCYPGLKPYQGTLTYTGITDHKDVASFEARVMPVLSPDNSFAAMRYFIENSEVRVYSEQMDVGSSFRSITDSSPLGWLSSAAERGLDVKFILDSSVNGGKSDEIVNTLNNFTEVKAISVNGRGSFDLIHNKGVIMDDTVWVGSVNWTEGSFVNNREFAVVIDSAEVAAFFADLFIEDWGVNEHTIKENGLEISLKVLSFNGSSVYMFTVSGPEHHAYSWDVLGNGTLRKSNINTIVCTGLPAGNHTITVTIDGTRFSASLEYFVFEEEKHAFNSDLVWIAVVIGLVAAGAACVIFRRRNIIP